MIITWLGQARLWQRQGGQHTLRQSHPYVRRVTIKCSLSGCVWPFSGENSVVCTVCLCSLVMGRGQCVIYSMNQ